MESENKNEIVSNQEIIYKSLDLLDVLKKYRTLHKRPQSREFIDYLRENVYDTYLKHIKNCIVHTNSSNLLNNRNVIIDQENTLTAQSIEKIFIKTIFSHNKWLIDFVKKLPYFVNLSDKDFATIVFQSQIAVLSFKLIEFRVDYNSYVVLEDNFRLSKNVMALICGAETTQVSIKIQTDLNQLNFTDRERALFLIFIMCQCIGTRFLFSFFCFFYLIFFATESKIENKEYFNILKDCYTSALVREFKKNHRDIHFAQKLNEVTLNSV